MTQFEWWDKVGSGMPPLDDEDAYEHVQRITAVCWDAARAAIPKTKDLQGEKDVKRYEVDNRN